jgi:hypothetical protein
MKTASRTLVMSPPEVWEQLDQPGRMQGLMAALLGRATDVDVYEREEESKLAWKADHGDGGAWIEVEIAEKGWGTNVSVTAENGGEPTKLEGWLDAVLDELATPQKRPFEGMTETPADTMSLRSRSRRPSRYRPRSRRAGSVSASSASDRDRPFGLRRPARDRWPVHIYPFLHGHPAKGRGEDRGDRH